MFPFTSRGPADEIPPTTCETCRRIEQSFGQNLAEDLRKLWRSLWPSSSGDLLTAGARAMRSNLLVQLGQPFDWWELNPYAMHKREFERTGDMIELERMLRHVERGNGEP